MSPNERYQALCDAVSTGDEELINHLITQELKDDPLDSVLYISVEEGNLPVLKAFADHAYGRNHIKFDGHNPVLETAVKKQHSHIVEYLLKQGANPNFVTLSYIQDHKLHTLLHMAVHIGHLQIVKLLLDHRADVNPQTEKNPKCFGIDMQGHPRIILNRTLTVLEVAIYKGDREIFDIILENGAFVEIESENVFPLHFAVQVGNKYAIEQLLDRGASINSVSRELENPLSFAVAYSKSEMVFDLIKRGATLIPNRINSVLYHFLRNCYQTEEIFDLLLNSGAVLHSATGITAFTLKICNIFCHRLEWRLFPDYGFDINSKESHGNTPLHLAVKYKDKLALEMLIEYDADFSILNTNRETPLSNASRLIDLHETERIITNNHHNLRNYFSKDRIKREERVLYLAIQAVILNEAIGKFVQNIDLNLLNNDSRFFYDGFRRELEEMKENKIKPNLSFYDIFAKTITALEMNLTKSTIQNLEYSVLEDFPLYGKMLKMRFAKIKERQILLETSGDRFKSLFGLENELPILVTAKISSYLTSLDFITLWRIFKSQGELLSVLLERTVSNKIHYQLSE